MKPIQQTNKSSAIATKPKAPNKQILTVMPDAVTDTGWRHCDSFDKVDFLDRAALEIPELSLPTDQFVIVTDSRGIKTVLVCPIPRAAKVPSSRTADKLSILTIEITPVPAKEPQLKSQRKQKSQKITKRSPQQSYGYSSGAASGYDGDDRSALSPSSRSSYSSYQSSPQTAGAADDYISQGQQSISDTSYSTSNTSPVQQNFRSTSGQSPSSSRSSPSSSSSSSSFSQSQEKQSPKSEFATVVHKPPTTHPEETSSSPASSEGIDTVSEDHESKDPPPAAPPVKPSPPPPPSRPPPSSTTAAAPTPTPTNGAAGSGLQLPSIPGITDGNNPGPEAQKPFDVSNLLKIGGSSVLGGGLTLVGIFFLVKYIIRRKNGGKQAGEEGSPENKNNDLEAGLGGMMASAGAGQQHTIGDDSGSQPT
ncbi:hypothetical protein QBC40DRAFT_274416 [Triangularia verruculosa]|uniref:Uncharacterized protein n=1 Tax=Triangularia verruculosa TaxID=2587418 RepID=A0AAN6XMZ3_9PEZI|nr:hypothetical protein QBC40DRAFT_274416 [Triangularia verruculosa]